MKNVYIVMGDYGFYMEPGVEIIRVFGNKKSAECFALSYEKQKRKRSCSSYHCWVVSRKVFY